MYTYHRHIICVTLTVVSLVSYKFMHTTLFFKFSTGIDKLADVRRLLMNVVEWQALGLELGLLYPTLKKIRKEQREDVEDCKIEMLAAWLLQKDIVSQKGVPTWSVLKKALKQIGENELAEKFLPGTDSE